MPDAISTFAQQVDPAPPHAPLDNYLELASRLGLERFVFVQPSAYGRDNTCMLDAMAEITANLRTAA